jgi:hypothetical protein
MVSRAASAGRLRSVSGLPTRWEAVGSVTSMMLPSPWCSVINRNDLTPADGQLGGDDEGARCGYGDVDSPLLGEQPLVTGVVDTCDDAWHRELGLAEQREHEVDLVVAGCSDDDVRSVDAGRLEGGKFASIGQHPVGLGHQCWPVVWPLTLDQQDLCGRR